MAILARALKWTAYSTAIGAWTMTPLLGFFVGDKHPSVAATALQMLIAVLLMLAALTVTTIDRGRRRRAPARTTETRP
jgi:hypothetical protein